MAHINILATKKSIYQAKKTWILLLFVESIIILAKTLEFADIFLKKLANILFK